MTHRPLPRPYDLSIDGLTVTIAHKPIKNLYLRVKPPYGNVEISAPLRMSEERILGFVRERRSWILRQRQRMEDALHRSVDSLQQAGGAPATEENSRGHGQSGSGDRRPLEGPANPAPVSTVRRSGPRSASGRPERRSMRRCRRCWPPGGRLSDARQRMSRFG